MIEALELMNVGIKIILQKKFIIIMNLAISKNVLEVV